MRQLLKHKYGKFAVKRGGLTVKTTIDPVLQEDARQAISDTMNFADAPAAAMVAIDPRTGEILAMQSSTDYSQSKFNLAVDAKRQAGSTFKTYGLLAGMVDFGIDPYTTQYATSPLARLPDQPRTRSARTTSGRSTMPSRRPAGVLPLDSALEESVNAVFARLSIDIGGYNVANMAYKLGIPRSDHLPTTPSVILGSGAVSPLDMTHAYSTIAANGVRRDLLAFTKVERYGGGVAKFKPDKGKAVIPDGATADVTKFLDANVHSCCTGLNANVGADRAAGRQDRHDRRPHRRLVLRLHAQPGRLRLGRLPARRGADGPRRPDPRPGVRRRLPGHDLERVRARRSSPTSRPSSRRRRGRSRGTS